MPRVLGLGCRGAASRFGAFGWERSAGRGGLTRAALRAYVGARSPATHAASDPDPWPSPAGNRRHVATRVHPHRTPRHDLDRILAGLRPHPIATPGPPP